MGLGGFHLTASQTIQQYQTDTCFKTCKIAVYMWLTEITDKLIAVNYVTECVFVWMFNVPKHWT